MSTIIIPSSSIELREVERSSTDQAHVNATINPPGAVLAHSDVLQSGRSIIVITILTLVLSVNSVTIGLLTVGIPHISADLELSEDLLLW